MLFSNQRHELRNKFFKTWCKYQQQQLLEPIEQQILQVIVDHPEYHALLDSPDKFMDKDYLPEFGETNPFLHMSLHLSIREQVATNRPNGIRLVYQQLLKRHQRNQLMVEHLMMELLAEQIWNAQRHQTIPDELHYLAKLQQLV